MLGSTRGFFLLGSLGKVSPFRVDELPGWLGRRVMGAIGDARGKLMVFLAVALPSSLLRIGSVREFDVTGGPADVGFDDDSRLAAGESSEAVDWSSLLLSLLCLLFLLKMLMMGAL